MSCFKGQIKCSSQDEKIVTNGIDDLKKPLLQIQEDITPGTSYVCVQGQMGWSRCLTLV
ncbi:unnamed protein product [Trifolium pratense]|uniref:Uncharacterized protein n=1 Tax=Trifolium pratense TaxID=57577 RepID=A0ACB0MB99_TRIPR|nr:unnamed protein product [Trifolium pratense]